MGAITNINRKLNEGKELTVLETLVFMCGNEEYGYFCRWYCTQEDERENFDVYTKKFMKDKSTDVCYGWLQIPQVQKAIKWYMKILYVQDMIRLYKTMYKKALSGEVNSANWCVKFADSDFFKDKQNELEEFLTGININDDSSGGLDE